MFLILSQVWSFGNKEDPLSYADTLIEEQKYDEAILYLTEFIKDYPDRFDQAQAKLRKIIEIRMAYNTQAEALLDVLVNEPTNNEKKIALIRDLENFEKNPSPMMRNFVTETKDLALFTFNRAQYESIMDNGRALIDQLLFAEAAAEYARGFELYRPEFIDAGYDPAWVQDIFAGVAEVEQAVADLAAFSERMSGAFSALPTQLSADNSALAAGTLDLSSAAAAAAAYSALRNRVSTQGRALEAAFAELTTDDETITENSFLPFAFRLVLGRRTGDQLEGITGAMDAQWAYILGSAQTAFEDRLAALYEQAVADHSAGSWEAASAGFAAGAELADAGLELVSYWSQLLPNELVNYNTSLGQAIFESKGRDYARLSHHGDLMRAWTELARLEADISLNDWTYVATEGSAAADGSDAAETEAGLTVAEISAAYNSRRQNLLALRQEILQLQAASAARADALAAVNAAGFAETVSAERQGAFDGYLRSGLARAESTSVRLAAAEAGNDWQELDRQYKSYLTLLDQASELLGGLPSDDPDLPDAIFRYPTRALTTTTEAQTALQRLADEISAFTTRYGAAEDFIASSAAMTLWLQQAAALAADTRTALQTGTSLSARARDQQRLAQSSRLEAELRVNESRAALNRSDFERARERLDRARDAYNASLDYEQNAELRRASDTALGELAIAILRAENDKVVADTRALITSGRALYLQGEFDRAENVLLQARARWATTNVVPMAEVEYWLLLVQNALAVKSGRDIPVTAPLYPEMSQLLANARKLYDEGRVLLSRDKISALNIFDQAKRSIEQVKLIFPLNQEASLILLRIMRLIDIDEFNRSAAEKVAAARAKITDGVNLPEAYADLKDIQSLEPRYPGLQALIERAEIALGFRLPPPDRAALAESASLLQAAQAIYNSRDTSLFAVAVAQLDRAIELNPDNRQAVSLKDQINTFIGGQAILVLPSAADAIYNEAVRRYTQGELPLVRATLIRLYQEYPQANQVQKVINLDAQLTAAGY